MSCRRKAKTQEKVKRETREETIARIQDVQGQSLRGEIPDIAEFRRRWKGSCKGCSGDRATQEESKGKGTRKAHIFKSCDKGTLRYKADVPLNARRGSARGRMPSHHKSSARVRARGALIDGHGHGFIYEHRLGLILVHNLG